MALENLDFRINAAVEAGNSAQTLAELKAAMKDLQNLAAQVGPANAAEFTRITKAAGQLNDQIKDVKEQTRALTGTSFERLNNSFRNLRQSIYEMDLDKFKNSLIGIKNSLLEFGGQMLSPFKNLGTALAGLVTGTTTLTAAMRALGGAIAATGIGALVVAVGLLVAYWDKLSTSGGLIGNTFKAINSLLEKTVGYFEKMLNQLGLIDTESKKSLVDYQQRVESLTNVQKKAVEILRKSYEDEKKLREANRLHIFKTKEEEQKAKEKYRLEDLQQEKKFYQALKALSEQRNKEDLESLKNQIRAKAKQYGMPEPQFKGNIVIRPGQESIAAGYTSERVEIISDKYLQETNELVKQYQQRAANDAKFKKGNQELAREASTNLIRIENELKDLEQESANDRAEIAKDLADEKKKASEKIVEAKKKEYDDLLKLSKEMRDKEIEASKKLATGAEAAYTEALSPEGQALKRKELAQKEAQDTYEASQKTIQDRMNLKSVLIGIERTYNDEITKLNNDAAQADKDAKERAADEELARLTKLEQDKLAIKQENTRLGLQIAQQASFLMGGIADLQYQQDLKRAGQNEKLQEEANKKNFKRNKAVSIVNAIVNTASAVSQINANPVVNADITQTLRGILTGLVVATGLAQVELIRRQEYNSNSISSGGGISQPSVSVPTTVTPSQFMNIGEFKPGDLQERRVYVVESDITGVQRKVQVIQNRSKF